MNKEDLKVGYVVEVKSNNEQFNGLCIVIEGTNGLGISGENYYSEISYFNDDLTSNIFNSSTKITKVYSKTYIRNAYKVSTEDRKLLWEREESKEMTIAEIEKELGYKVKVIKEESND